MLYRLERTGKVQHEKPHRGVAPSLHTEVNNPIPRLPKRPGSTLVYGARRDQRVALFSPAYVPLPLTSELRRCQSQLPSSSPGGVEGPSQAKHRASSVRSRSLPLLSTDIKLGRVSTGRVGEDNVLRERVLRGSRGRHEPGHCFSDSPPPFRPPTNKQGLRVRNALGRRRCRPHDRPAVATNVGVRRGAMTSVGDDP